MTVILAASAFEAQAALIQATGAPTKDIIVILVAGEKPGLDPNPPPGEREMTWRSGLFDDDDLITWEDAEWR